MLLHARRSHAAHQFFEVGGDEEWADLVERELPVLAPPGELADGLGVGGGVYNLGTFTFDMATRIKKNHASTSNDDIFP